MNIVDSNTAPELRDLDTPERSRTYVFSDGRYTIKNVTRLAVSARGTHRVEDAAGNKYIVRCGWLAIEVDVDAWSF